MPGIRRLFTKCSSIIVLEREKERERESEIFTSITLFPTAFLHSHELFSIVIIELDE